MQHLLARHRVDRRNKAHLYAQSPSIAANDPTDAHPAYSIMKGATTEQSQVFPGIAVANAASASATIPYDPANSTVYDAFAAFDVLDTYWNFATGDLGLKPASRGRQRPCGPAYGGIFRHAEKPLQRLHGRPKQCHNHHERGVL